MNFNTGWWSFCLFVWFNLKRSGQQRNNERGPNDVRQRAGHLLCESRQRDGSLPRSTLATFQEDPGSDPSTHMGHNHL